jgi:hypothetical protein
MGTLEGKQKSSEDKKGITSADCSESAIQDDRENRRVVRVIKLGCSGRLRSCDKGHWRDLCEHNHVIHLTEGCSESERAVRR